MTVVICPSCRGAKKTMQMGMLYGKCILCKGDGCIKKQGKIEVPIPAASLDDTVSKIQTKMVEDKKEVIHGRKETQKEKRHP